MEALHWRSLEFQKCLLRIRTFKLDQYFRRKVFLVCKAKLLSLSYSQTSQRAIEDVCLPSPCWLPSWLGKGGGGVGRGKMLGRGSLRSFWSSGTGSPPSLHASVSLPRCPKQRWATSELENQRGKELRRSGGSPGVGKADQEGLVMTL